MSRSGLRTILLGSIIFLASSSAFAQCTEDRRGQEVGDQVVQLRTYLCRTGRGPNEPQIKVELDRLSDAAASVVITKGTSGMLSQVIGAPKLIDNDVSKTYSDLLRQFGVTLGRELSLQAIKVDGAGSGGTGSSSEHILDKGIRILGHPYFASALDYPAIDEMDALKKKKIPSGLQYFYSVACKNDEKNSTGGITSICKNYDPKETTMLFWRSMKADDLTKYSRRLIAYNRRYAPGADSKNIVIPRELRLANHLAGETWPEDFMIITGTPNEGGCALGPFFYGLRVFMLDVAIIENVSSAPISVDDLLGGHLTDTRLRVADSLAPRAKSGNPLGFVVGTLAPGEKVLVPLRILLRPDEGTTDQFRYRQTADQIHNQVGAGGYSGNFGGYGAPKFRNYVYGPEVAISGLVVNGTRVDLAGQSANYLEITMSSESGSCPYLLSQAQDGDWIDHGKVLHKAPNGESEYTELRTFDSFKHRFRLEEREPEMAFIDQAELVAVLKSGETLTLAADNPKLATRDGDYLRLLWGDVVEINFSLPDQIREEEVVESRFSVTGYYRRYSDLMAKGTNEPITRRSGLTSGLGATSRALPQSQR
jgi:hypothetical protein